MTTLSQTTRNRASATLRFVALCILSLLLLFPVYWMLMSAILPSEDVISTSPTLLPTLERVDFSNFTEIFTATPFALWILNSAIISVVAISVNLLVSIPAGYALSRYRSRTQQLLGYVLLLSLMLPGTLLIIPLFVTFSSLDLLNNLFAVGVLTATTVIPFSAWMMRTYFDSIPKALEEAAMIDGCTQAGALMRVILPISGPGIAAILAYSAIWSWSEYLFAVTLLRDASQWPATVAIVTYFVGEYTIDWGGIMAAGLVAALPLVLIFLFLQRMLVSGLAGGAVKD